jgi:hypothetical protein
MKTTSAKRRAQVSIEFFFIVAFSVALATILLSSAEDQIRNVKSLDNTALARAALDSVASTVNYVSLAGNGTRIAREVFVPNDVTCFAYNSSSRKMFCSVGAGVFIQSSVLYSAPSVASACLSSGWLRAEAVNNGASTSLNCSSLA